LYLLRTLFFIGTHVNRRSVPSQAVQDLWQTFADSASRAATWLFRFFDSLLERVETEVCVCVCVCVWMNMFVCECVSDSP
jgi:hypothetical protein